MNNVPKSILVLCLFLLPLESRVVTHDRAHNCKGGSGGGGGGVQRSVLKWVSDMKAWIYE